MAVLLKMAVESPGRFQRVDAMLRKVRFQRFNFFIYFTEIDEGHIQVVALVHARRSPEWIQRRLSE